MMVPAVRLYGDISEQALLDAGKHLVGLCDAISADKGFDLRFSLGTMARECDQCGYPVPFTNDLPNGWSRDGMYDICEACTVENYR